MAVADPSGSRDRLDLTVQIGEGEGPLHHSLWEVCTALGPGWQAVQESEIAVDVVKGGITNLLYKVTSPAGLLLVRVYGAKTELVIDRDKETTILRQLSDMKFSVGFHGSFGNGRLEEWTHMRALLPSELFQRAPVNFSRIIAKELADLHALRPEEPGNPDRRPMLLDTVRRFADLAVAINFDDSPKRQAVYARIDLPGMVREFEWLMTLLPSERNRFGEDLSPSEDPAKRQAASFACASVFCHNDLLCGNILVDAEGGSQLIDFEYSGYSHRAFDIANHFVEYAGFDADWGRWHPTIDEMKHFLEAYVAHAIELQCLPSFKDQETERAFLLEVLRWVERYCLASHLFWGFWAIVQARNSPIDFDFLDYSRARFVGYFYTKGLYARNFFSH